MPVPPAPAPAVAGHYFSEVVVVPGALSHVGPKAYAADGAVCPMRFQNLTRKSRALAAALLRSSLAREEASSEGFLPVRQVADLARLSIEALRQVGRFSHVDGTPRFQLVTIPTDTGDQEYIRAPKLI